MAEFIDIQRPKTPRRRPGRGARTRSFPESCGGCAYCAGQGTNLDCGKAASGWADARIGPTIHELCLRFQRQISIRFRSMSRQTPRWCPELLSAPRQSMPACRNRRISRKNAGLRLMPIPMLMSLRRRKLRALSNPWMKMRSMSIPPRLATTAPRPVQAEQSALLFVSPPRKANDAVPGDSRSKTSSATRARSMIFRRQECSCGGE